MKNKFQLASNIIGLILVSTGAILCIYVLASFFQFLIVYSSVTEEMKEPTGSFLVHFSINLFIMGVSHLLFGLYMMKKDNFFVKFSYPDKKSFGTEEEALHSLENEVQTNIDDFTEFAPK